MASPILCESVREHRRLCARVCVDTNILPNHPMYAATGWTSVVRGYRDGLPGCGTGWWRSTVMGMQYACWRAVQWGVADSVGACMHCNGEIPAANSAGRTLFRDLPVKYTPVLP